MVFISLTLLYHILEKGHGTWNIARVYWKQLYKGQRKIISTP